ncbi:unnamed protein product [Lasius platythorax]|uniref:Uncharacterized protein n=1 Tax=Lasius platythorax TaxID=488582 RepID=A0AAV2NVA7_9HYME
MSLEQYRIYIEISPRAMRMSRTTLLPQHVPQKRRGALSRHDRNLVEIFRWPKGDNQLNIRDAEGTKHVQTPLSNCKWTSREACAYIECPRIRGIISIINIKKRAKEK